FGGTSFAALAGLATSHFQFGVGPAVLLATWQMTPSTVPGVWVDATSRIRSLPLIARVQYRFYGAATRVPDRGFTSFHASTLFMGVGFVTGFDNPLFLPWANRRRAIHRFQ